MDATVSPDRLSSLVGAIYDCAVDPSRWGVTLEAIRLEMRFRTAVLSSHALPSGRLLLDVYDGLAPPWAERVHDYDDSVLEIWGGPDVAGSFPLGEPAILSRINPGAFEPPVNRYIAEWGTPQGLVNSMAVVVARDGASVGAVAFGHHGDQGPIGPAEIDLARLLAPHIQRSIGVCADGQFPRARQEGRSHHTYGLHVEGGYGRGPDCRNGNVAWNA